MLWIWSLDSEVHTLNEAFRSSGLKRRATSLELLESNSVWNPHLVEPRFETLKLFRKFPKISLKILPQNLSVSPASSGYDYLEDSKKMASYNDDRIFENDFMYFHVIDFH